MGIQCIRFGELHNGTNTGCCGVDVFQGFNFDPDGEHEVELSYGDSHTPLMRFDEKNNSVRAKLGPTNKDVFLSYLKIGTFSLTPMPSRGFLAVITERQVGSEAGMKWLKLFKENGFEHVRTIHNSVYSSQRKLYLFALFRNTGPNALDDPFEAPAYWNELGGNEKQDHEELFKKLSVNYV